MAENSVDPDVIGMYTVFKRGTLSYEIKKMYCFFFFVSIFSVIVLIISVLHTVQINFHAVDVNKYRYIQIPIGLLIF